MSSIITFGTPAPNQRNTFGVSCSWLPAGSQKVPIDGRHIVTVATRLIEKQFLRETQDKPTFSRSLLLPTESVPQPQPPRPLTVQRTDHLNAVESMKDPKVDKAWRPVQRVALHMLVTEAVRYNRNQLSRHRQATFAVTADEEEFRLNKPEWVLLKSTLIALRGDIDLLMAPEQEYNCYIGVIEAIAKLRLFGC